MIFGTRDLPSGRFASFAAPSGERPLVAHLRRLGGVSNRRKEDTAGAGLGRLSWAESAPTGVASGRTGVRAVAVIPLCARNGLNRSVVTPIPATPSVRLRPLVLLLSEHRFRVRLRDRLNGRAMVTTRRAATFYVG
jgi:hypothetical protein